MKNQRIKPEHIINKMHTCNCGCQGQDPWHKRNYKRVVRNISEDGLSGEVWMPYSTKPVKVTRDTYGMIETCLGTKESFGTWVVDRDSIEWDKW